MINKKTGIVMATMLEASPFIKGLALKKIADKPFPVYSSDNLLLIVSGIGRFMPLLLLQCLFASMV
jgi:hypothetical protein